MNNNHEILRHTSDNGRRLHSAPESHLLTGHHEYAARPVERVGDDLDFDFQAVLHAVIRRRGWIFASTAAMLALTALACFFMTPRYQAESTLEILKQNAGPLPMTSDPAAN